MGLTVTAALFYLLLALVAVVVLHFLLEHFL